MTEQELKQANKTKAPVEWRGMRDFERAQGQVTALIYRFIDGKEVLSAEITAFTSPRHILFCKPEDLYPLSIAK